MELEAYLMIFNTLIYVEHLFQPNMSLYDAVIHFEEKGYPDFDYPGELSLSEYIELADYIKAEQTTFEQIMIKDMSTVDKDARKATLVFDDAIYIVYEGTASPAEWQDNKQGSLIEHTDTLQQMRAVSYFDEQIAAFKDDSIKNVYVSGHSKGGNKAHYVMCNRGDQITKAYSFNGQGFNFAFLNKYHHQITEHKHKMVSVNNDKDYVSILLYDIADTTIYRTSKTTFGDSLRPYRLIMHKYLGVHALYSMFSVSDSQEFSLNKKTDQAPLMVQFQELTRFFESYMRNDDWKYTAHIMMAGFSDQSLTSHRMPVGYTLRVLALTSAFQKKTQQTLLFDVSNLFIMPKITFPFKIGDRILASFIPVPYSLVVRDFSYDAKQYLLSQVQHENPLSIDHHFMSQSGLQHALLSDELSMLRRNVAQIDTYQNTATLTIHRIFDEVYAHEAAFSKKLSIVHDKLQQFEYTLTFK